MKIGFLAMSGVRACDPRLLELGLTLPGFVSRSKVIASLPSLGLLYLAAVTPEHHDIVYHDVENIDALPDSVVDCDLVAINTFSAQAPEAYAVADRLRESGVLVAIGGLHASVMPKEALAHADFVVVGEGENTWPEVIRAAEEGRRGMIFNARNFPSVDIDKLPVPRFDLLADRPYNRFTIQTSRGCPWCCDFCASSVMLGRPFRQRPVDGIIRDLEALMAVREKPYLEFADDNTFANKRWGRELCDALEPYGLKWFTETDLSVADDRELLRRLRPAGCRQLLVGLESPNSQALTGVEEKFDFKARRVTGMADAIRRIQDHGVTVNGCFVLGLDHDTVDSFQRIRDFAFEVPLYEVQITVMTPFPGTPLYGRLEKEGRLLYPGRWDRCTLFDVNFQPRNMSVEELQEGLYQLMEDLYSHDAVRSRREKVIKRWRNLTSLRTVDA
ncbi:MAG: cobalamin-dependent protein [Candidatus Sumerlaeia bacterium]|nr:cobalamin-dependent protein [Candidatus Sumerlaeia bacterium]